MKGFTTLFCRFIYCFLKVIVIILLKLIKLGNQNLFKTIKNDESDLRVLLFLSIN